MPTATYTVAGMTCGHCVQAVTTALSVLDGVIDVSVDLDSGAVTVTSTSTLDTASVRGAVEETGYTVTGRTYGQTCPRCGEDFTAAQPDEVADAVVAHARDAHGHALQREVVLAHLAGVRPEDLDIDED